MKKILGVGSVITDKAGMAHYLVRDTKTLKEVIIPLFDSFPLLTTKEFSYNQFKTCLDIANDITLDQETKIILIKKEKSNKCPEDFIPSK